MKTPLYGEHVRAGAKIVDFHGWDMPLQYSGIVEEHHAVRTRAGLFDLSHMGRVWITGPDRKAFLNRVLTVDAGVMKHGRCRYAFFLTERGTVVDDLLVYEDTARDRALLVVNASNREKDLDWMGRHATGFQVRIEDATSRMSLIAVQGPSSVNTLKRSLDIAPGDMKYYTFTECPILDTNQAILSRTGYTGEDGFEIFVPAERASAVWNAILRRSASDGLVPVGLGARDTLRTEAAMPLYGQEIDESTTPLEAGLDFAVALDKPDFIGRAALQTQRKDGVSKKLVGFHMAGKRIPRHGMDAFAEGVKTGIVTSGTFSPSLSRPIGMAHVRPEHAAVGTALEIDIRGRREPATIVPLPFYRKSK
ncbi:MAG: glycine cleavage system aminomethyltransferase GcvT [Planctomycetes bacterium]|nr:glycine cleavage system aminomethyltransferase GcvT [Planctomycetota bacterium]